MDIPDLITRIKLPFLRDRELYRSFRQVLGFYPRDIRPYKVAILHRSASQRMVPGGSSQRSGGMAEEGRRINNERLEFLGDAILGAVVGHIVYRHFPRKPEGFLTNTRSNIVRRQSLNKLAQEIGFDKLIVSNFKPKTHNSYVNGNAFEALVGAIYLDRGYAHCVRFVRDRIMSQLVNIEKVASEVNYKSKLIEWGQKNRINVDFNVRQTTDHEASPVFVCSVVIADTVCGNGSGYSKKESQQRAAREALEHLHRDREFTLALLAPKEQQMERYDDIVPVSAEEKQEIQSSVATHEDSKPDESIDIDFSEITMRAKTREEIIAEAERKAFEERME